MQSSLLKKNTLFETICEFLSIECGFKITNATINRILEFIQHNSFLEQLSYEELIVFLRKNLISFILNNETYFFRNKDQIDKIIDYYKTQQIRGNLKILSFGCSTGEECYSLSIKFFLENINNYEIIGIDIDKDALEKAKKGEYTENSFRGNIDFYKNFFVKEKNKYLIKSFLKTNVKFIEINLLKENILKYFEEEYFDIILANNVLIYLDDKAINVVLNQLNQVLNKNGLFLTSKEESHIVDNSHIFTKDEFDNSVFKKINIEDVIKQEFRELYESNIKSDDENAENIYKLKDRYKNLSIEQLKNLLQQEKDKFKILAIYYLIFENSYNPEDLKNFITKLIENGFYNEGRKWLKTYLMIINPTEKDLNDYIDLCIKTKNYDDLINILKKKIKLFKNENDIKLYKTLTGKNYE
ncbi:hypothetical protein DEFDS_0950 [Deferribacter desulfuricans SSM1]|uniref:CheR-type methyltransferase domain-containing protein n=1 Tax=Deferribacter desulfuricans (strain DSM 14783 / JCM 11476 / NBRC 101012 / SSM1) TaxID=639282 RepID=D3PCU9_DEFDS|nr:CheR family methyltransferase [Deferribacter desulfuricans]BAI80422.1 hypothetical protein DEFDS_0950 [Deferribacter desulfuricans SSM1]